MKTHQFEAEDVYLGRINEEVFGITGLYCGEKMYPQDLRSVSKMDEKIHSSPGCIQHWISLALIVRP